MGSASLSPADKPRRPNDCRSTAGRAKLGPGRSFASEALGSHFAFVGWARIAFGCSRADLGLACGTRPSRGKLTGPACNMGVSGRARRAGPELGRTTARTPFWGAGAYMGCTLGFAAACCTCATTCRAFVGRPRRRAVQAGHGAGDIVESAGSVMGSAEAGHATGSVSTRDGRLGPASRRIGAAADRGALLGRAGRSRVGCAEDRGACSSRGAVMVCARSALGGARRSSSAVERASTDCGMVSACSGSCRTRRRTLNRRHAGRRSRERVTSG